MHGAFPIGLVLMASFVMAAAIEAWRRLRWGFFRDRWTIMVALCLAASVAATLINPYGWRVYEYVIATSSAAAKRRIDEWVPPGLDLMIGKFWVASLALVLVGIGASARRPSAREVCLLLCFLPLACGSARMIAWWLLVSAPILAAQFSALPALNVPFSSKLPEPRPQGTRPQGSGSDQPSFASAVSFSVIVLLMALCLPGLDEYNPLLRRKRELEPGRTSDLVAAADYVTARGGSGRVFSRFEWGEYLTWLLGPRFPVFMDGRIEIFPDEVWVQYSTVTVGRVQWHQVLSRYSVDYLLLDAPYHRATGLLDQVEQSSEWELVLRAGDCLLYARHPTEHAAVERQ